MRVVTKTISLFLQGIPNEEYLHTFRYEKM